MASTQNPRYFNRELSWLEFNQRVLDEARDPSIPLLERLKFLAITDSNLDEFFMVRVGSLKTMRNQGLNDPDPAGWTVADQLAAIRERTREMMASQYECLLKQLEPALAEGGITRGFAPQLSESQLQAVRRVFDTELKSVLSPMAVDEDNFPLLANQTLNLLVRLNPSDGSAEGSGEPRFAIIPLLRPARRFLTLQVTRGYGYILLEEIVALFVEDFFRGELVQEVAPFRITRNADMSVREDLAPDLLTGMEEVLDARRVSPCVRLQIADWASPDALDFLKRCLNLSDDDIFLAPGPLNLAAFMELASVAGFRELKYERWKPQPSPQVDLSSSMFDVITDHDVLLYHPYDSFDPVVKLVEEAADDPDVMAIKQILYRTSRKSPIVAALARAADNGKYVTVIVELKARFDEARNIEWARALEQAGVQVIYGVKGLKTHAKLLVIVRREPQGVQRYMHFGTGNYNESTARLYGDISYLTCDEELGADATAFFHAITGYSQPQQFQKLEMAPLGLRQRLLELIDGEKRFIESGQEARIDAKLNSLVDAKLIEALYAASQAGVRIRLNIRGICCLRPGVPGLSDNIEVVSIVDRYLEHARIIYFAHGGEPRVFISSADWMPRNLDRRVELLTPVEDPDCQKRLISFLETHFQDTVKARRLHPDGSYAPLEPAGPPLRSQERLYQLARDAVDQAQKSRRLMFEPHKAPHED